VYISSPAHVHNPRSSAVWASSRVTALPGDMSRAVREPTCCQNQPSDSAHPGAPPAVQVSGSARPTVGVSAAAKRRQPTNATTPHLLAPACGSPQTEPSSARKARPCARSGRVGRGPSLAPAEAVTLGSRQSPSKQGLQGSHAARDELGPAAAVAPRLAAGVPQHSLERHR